MSILKWKGWVISIIGLALVHCDTGEKYDITSNALASECGGLGNHGVPGNTDKYDDESNTNEESDYCKAETIEWTYVNGTLTIRNNRVLANCCGNREIKVVEKFFGFYTIKETDAPAEGGHCDCFCVIDYLVSIENVYGNIVFIELIREVINDDASYEVKTIASALLDLTEHSGSFVVNEEDASPWCE